MIELFIHFAVSAAVIITAGIFLTKASDSIAELTGLGRLLIGSILLAGTTSLPELFVDISAIRKGMPDLAVGDLMGSSLLNLLILAVADLFHRQKAGMFSRLGALHALSGAMSINMAAMAGGAILLGPTLARFDIGPFGIGPLAIACTYILGVRLIYYDQKARAKDAERPAAPQNKKRALVRQFSILLTSALAVLVAAPYLAEAAGGIADLSGLGKTFVGSTLVAFSTSLPEVVSTIAAVKMGAFDLAIGNIFGSNSYNMIILFPLDWVHKGSLLASVSSTHVVTCLAVILATSVAIMGQLYQVETRKKFIEPDAFTIIAIVAGALLVLYHLGAS